MIVASPTPKPVCSRCRSARHLIIGDGPVVCYPCVGLLTDAAADPVVVTQRLRDLLAELHADVVKLVAEDGTLSWQWIPQWPAARA